MGVHHDQVVVPDRHGDELLHTAGLDWELHDRGGENLVVVAVRENKHAFVRLKLF